MVVGANCKVYTGSSPAGLIHALSQAGVNFTEIGNGGGAAGAALAADLEAMKQQAAASEQAAAERSEQLTAALRQVQDASAAEMRALRTKVAEGQEQAESLRGDLGRAYNLMEANPAAVVLAVSHVLVVRLREKLPRRPGPVTGPVVRLD
jgi:hypothetical protein